NSHNPLHDSTGSQDSNNSPKKKKKVGVKFSRLRVRIRCLRACVHITIITHSTYSNLNPLHTTCLPRQ
ncbi:MAG: hypothetical protein ACPIOQ_60045, partial [Promethearchaeia archaeon]